MKKEIALIGFGRFGRFASRHLRRDFRVFVVDQQRPLKKDDGISRVSLKEAAKKKIIILAVPVNKLRGVLQQLSPLLSPGTLVCDVCSVKEQPVRWMRELLPDDVNILGLHPLFGPDSAAKSLIGRTIVICPVHIPRQKLRSAKHYFEKKGLIVHQTTPSRHDKLMASTLFLTQFVGHALNKLVLLKTTLTTKNFELLAEIASTTGNDTQELFHDMYRFNRFAKTIPKSVIGNCRLVARNLSK